MAKAKFIFRWKEENIEVTLSKAETEAEVWAWAEVWLRGATETPQQGKEHVHKYGEAIPYKKG